MCEVRPAVLVRESSLQLIRYSLDTGKSIQSDIGSPLSPVVANLFMEAFEEKALKSAVLSPRLWVRYVDDTFVLWQHGADELEKFLQYLNNQHHSIQFTMEKESESKIPFLDVRVERKEGKISTEVYRKRTHTDLYINFASHHHPHTKTGIIACLRDRAENICDGKNVRSEKQHLVKVFQANGYPKSMICRQLYRHRRAWPQQGEQEVDEEKPKVIILPYLHRLLEHIQRICRHIGIRAVFKTHGTLRELLTKVKTPQPDLMKKGVVYRVQCMDCDGSYIGERGRSLRKRLGEHKSAVKRGDESNGIAVHACRHKYRVDWEGRSLTPGT